MHTQDLNRRLRYALEQPVLTGQELVKFSRDILKLYSACGFSIDDDEIESILAIESETDTMDLRSNLESTEFQRVYDLYRSAFEDSRSRTLAKVGGNLT